MNKSAILLLTSLFLLICNMSINAQKLTHVQGELLVRFHKTQTPQDILQDHRSFRGRSTYIKKGRCLSETQNIWTLTFDWTQIHETDFMDQIKDHPSVETAQLNHILEERLKPNDPFYDLQWFFYEQEGNIGAELAWDITTGGLTPSGDTIVICVLDNGLERTHQDIVDNLWINHAEIPDNGLDDDNNGYVDDYYGWNAEERNGNISSSNFHGTRVAGMVGAVGNNGIGVTGINWNVKLMIVRAYLGQIVESRIIEGYEYVLTQRRLYNETNGAEGAYVVATNSSWGYSGIKEEDYPIWCAIYDTLGQAGIINIAATENDNIDVDAKGDLPTACSSPYLITVTSTGRSGAKLTQAGFGRTTIDLGAPGSDMYTTFISNTFNYDAGTSMAAPLVAGSVGMLYASPCPTLDLLSESEPSEAALLAKDIILRSTVSDSSLIDKTVTGGRLHIFNALQLLDAECTDCFPPLSIQVVERDQENVTLSWVQASDVQQIDLRYRVEGEAGWTEITNVGDGFRFENLTACTVYEVQFNAFCTDSETGYGETFTFKTDGCCEPPQNIRFEFIGQDEILLSWESVLAANNYLIRYRPVGDPNWQEKRVIQTITGLQNLMSCTMYELQFQVACAGGPSAFGPILSFTTRGCGTCIEEDYCSAGTLVP
ncbi:MAG: S8 family serine peptidase, partial [Saprospiraceae bacterium]|nr:S8 family serine peptidase [Saprospiraceae bacterium]